MNNKEQIIVDNVDVSECDFSLDCIGIICQLKNGRTDKCNCSDYPNCYFKQLARKSQECESLKQEIEILKDNFDTATRDCNELIEELRQECEELKEKLRELELKNTTLQNRNQQLDGSMAKADRYRKALEEIKELLPQLQIKILFITVGNY